MESLFEKNEDLEVVRKLVPSSTWYRSLCYQTEKSWSRLRRVVTKVCYESEGFKIRHVVTSLPAAKITPSELYLVLLVSIQLANILFFTSALITRIFLAHHKYCFLSTSFTGLAL